MPTGFTCLYIPTTAFLALMANATGLAKVSKDDRVAATTRPAGPAGDLCGVAADVESLTKAVHQCEQDSMKVLVSSVILR